DLQFILACTQNMDKDKLVDLSKVASSLGYTNVASCANRFRAIRKRLGITNLESKTGSGIIKATATAEETQTNASSMTSTTKATATKASEPEISALAKPKAAKKTSGRKGAKISSKPIPATDAPKVETKGHKRGAK
ncbi:hypothetical protein BO71DRAFT_290376, partial [Aspergillus ellipticus CBS 707.79]